MNTNPPDSNLDKIILSHMEFFGYHGVFPEENRLGQRFIIDLELGLSLENAGRSDSLEDSVNYDGVYHTVKSIVEGETVRLIEALAERVASDILQTYTSIHTATVRVTKPNPPVRGTSFTVAVEINRKRA